jgi:hypothetical protein
MVYISHLGEFLMHDKLKRVWLSVGTRIATNYITLFAGYAFYRIAVVLLTLPYFRNEGVAFVLIIPAGIIACAVLGLIGGLIHWGLLHVARRTALSPQTSSS